MSRAHTFHRPRAILAALAIAVCVALVYWTLQGLGVIPVATRSERVGQFEVAYTTYDAFGHRGTSRTLHYRGSSRRHLVSREVGVFEFNPHDPHGVLYEHCSNGERPECGIHYFDGRRQRGWKVSNEQVIHQSAANAVSWSPDKRFVVLAGQFHLQIASLDSARTIDMSKALDLHAMPGLRSVHVEEWSPDLRKLTVLVAEYLDEMPPLIRVASDLIVIDPHDGSARYVATAQPRGWRNRSYRWLQTPNGYVMSAPPDGQGIDGTIYRKGTADLPAGLAPQ